MQRVLRTITAMAILAGTASMAIAANEAAGAASAYHSEASIPLADGFWDIATYDAEHNRVLVARGAAVSVIDMATKQSRDIGQISRGHAALACLEKDQAFDTILCDLLMHGMNGMELHAELQRRWPGLANRIVFMTGGAFTEAAQEFLARVPNTCIQKPFDLRSLRAAIAGTS